MGKQRKQHSTQFKFRLAMEAAQGQHTLNELSSQHGVHPNQIGQWKRQLLEQGPQLFAGPALAGQQRAQQAREIQLFEQIGRLQMELEWLKKNLPVSLEARRMMTESAHPQLSVRQQCDLLGLARASFYYQPAPETPLNLELMTFKSCWGSSPTAVKISCTWRSI